MSSAIYEEMYRRWRSVILDDVDRTLREMSKNQTDHALTVTEIFELESGKKQYIHVTIEMRDPDEDE